MNPISIILTLLAIALFIVMILMGKDKNHPKYPPTDTLGGWD